jgi:hypothetical protein
MQINVHRLLLNYWGPVFLQKFSKCVDTKVKV